MAEEEDEFLKDDFDKTAEDEVREALRALKHGGTPPQSPPHSPPRIIWESEPDPVNELSNKGRQLMHKWGYIPGKGLGKNNQGNYQPVAFKYVPNQNRGKDKCCIGFGAPVLKEPGWVRPIGIHKEKFIVNMLPLGIAPEEFRIFQKGKESGDYVPPPHFIIPPLNDAKNTQKKISADPIISPSPLQKPSTPLKLTQITVGTQNQFTGIIITAGKDRKVKLQPTNIYPKIPLLPTPAHKTPLLTTPHKIPLLPTPTHKIPLLPSPHTQRPPLLPTPSRHVHTISKIHITVPNEHFNLYNQPHTKYRYPTYNFKR